MIFYNNTKLLIPLKVLFFNFYIKYMIYKNIYDKLEKQLNNN